MIARGLNYEIRTGDCLEELGKLVHGAARLVVADPPYNFAVDYGNGAAADRLPVDQYRDWCGEWVRQSVDLLTYDGSLWLIVPDEHAAELVVLAKSLGLTLRNWVKWYETFGVNCRRKFNRTSRHVLYFTRDPKRFVFNADAVRVPSARQRKYNDRRANPAGKLPDDVWAFPRVAGTHAERLKGFPTQLPVAMLRRIVAVASNPGDLVLDPFCGSGSTGAAAIAHGRRFIGIEKNPDYAARAARRLDALTAALDNDREGES
jgi:DNA modification methylase